MPCLPADCITVTVLRSRSLITGSVLLHYIWLLNSSYHYEGDPIMI